MRKFGWTYRRLALVAEELRDFPTAFIYYDSALVIARPLEEGQSELLASLFLDLGYARASLFQGQKAQEYFDQALAVYRRRSGPQSVDLGEVYTQIGNNYINNGEYRLAEASLHKALSIYQQQLKSRCLSVLSCIYLSGLFASKIGELRESYSVMPSRP